MFYTINLEMEIMELEDGERVIFDPTTGDTHFLEAVGVDILKLLDTPKDMDELVLALSKEYDADAEMIRADVTPFMDKLVEANIIMQLL